MSCGVMWKDTLGTSNMIASYVFKTRGHINEDLTFLNLDHRAGPI